MRKDKKISIKTIILILLVLLGTRISYNLIHDFTTPNDPFLELINPIYLMGDKIVDTTFVNDKVMWFQVAPPGFWSNTYYVLKVNDNLYKIDLGHTKKNGEYEFKVFDEYIEFNLIDSNGRYLKISQIDYNKIGKKSIIEAKPTN